MEVRSPAAPARGSLTPSLLSDPTENDSITGLRPNARGPGLVTFGPDRVKEFLDLNNLQARAPLSVVGHSLTLSQMIIRAHECVMDGFERFAAGQLITVFCTSLLNVGRTLSYRPAHSCNRLLRDRAQRWRDSGARTGSGAPPKGTARAAPTNAPDLQTLYPKLIHPLPPQAAFDEEECDGGQQLTGTWMQSLNSERPPTPPRGRLGAGHRPPLDEF